MIHYILLQTIRPSHYFLLELFQVINLRAKGGEAFDQFLDAAREVPEAVEIQNFLGRVDVRVSVIARDMGHYQEIYRDRILTLPHITDIEALMQVATIKQETGLPLRPSWTRPIAPSYAP